jgi:hypothetical protein
MRRPVDRHPARLTTRQGGRATSPRLWFADETDACFIVKDHAGMSLAYVYFEEEPGRAAAKLLTRRRGAADRREHRQAAGAARGVRMDLSSLHTQKITE